MGSYLSTKNTEGLQTEICSPWSSVRNTLRPLDLILFSGSDFTSDMIRFFEKRGLKKETVIDIGVASESIPPPGIFSHVGIVVTSDILVHPDILPGKKYILESTISGPRGFGVPNVENAAFFGVQLRDLDLLIPAYLGPKDNKIAIGYLKSTPLLDLGDKEVIKARFTKLYNDIINTRYDFNPIDLGSTVIEWCRGCRPLIDRITGTRSWLFCSELVAMVYKEFDILPRDTNAMDIAPMEYVGYYADITSGGREKTELPIVIKLPVTYIFVQVYSFV